MKSLTRMLFTVSCTGLTTCVLVLERTVFRLRFREVQALDTRGGHTGLRYTVQYNELRISNRTHVLHLHERRIYCLYPTVSAKIDKLPKILAASRRMGRVAAVCYSVLRYWGVEENYVAAAPHADAIASSADACAQNHFLARTPPPSSR